VPVTIRTRYVPGMSLLRRTQWSALAVLAFALAACGGPDAVPLDELAANPEAFVGETVSTVGRVRSFGPEDGATSLHYVIEDSESNRVELLPAERARPHEGEFVRVIGTFTFDERVGRRLQIEEIEQPER
jgi:hypothetical protein